MFFFSSSLLWEHFFFMTSSLEVETGCWIFAGSGDRWTWRRSRTARSTSAEGSSRTPRGPGQYVPKQYLVIRMVGHLLKKQRVWGMVGHLLYNQRVWGEYGLIQKYATSKYQNKYLADFLTDDRHLFESENWFFCRLLLLLMMMTVDAHLVHRHFVMLMTLTQLSRCRRDGGVFVVTEDLSSASRGFEDLPQVVRDLGRRPTRFPEGGGRGHGGTIGRISAKNDLIKSYFKNLSTITNDEGWGA